MGSGSIDSGEPRITIYLTHLLQLARIEPGAHTKGKAPGNNRIYLVNTSHLGNVQAESTYNITTSEKATAPSQWPDGWMEQVATTIITKITGGIHSTHSSSYKDFKENYGFHSSISHPVSSFF